MLADIEYAILGITAVCQTIFITTAILTIFYKKHPIIKAASVSLCIVMSTGAAVWTSANYMWLLQANVIACNMRIWLLSIGFTMMIAPLIIKTYRVQLIFAETHLHVVSTDVLSKGLVLIMVLDVMYNTLMTLISDPAVMTNDCEYASDGAIFITIAMKGTQLAILMVVTFRLRNVPDPFNEAGQIWFCLSVLIIIAVFVIPTVLLSQERTYSYSIHSIGILLAAITVVASIIWTKFYGVKNYVKPPAVALFTDSPRNIKRLSTVTRVSPLSVTRISPQSKQVTPTTTPKLELPRLAITIFEYDGQTQRTPREPDDPKPGFLEVPL